MNANCNPRSVWSRTTAALCGERLVAVLLVFGWITRLTLGEDNVESHSIVDSRTLHRKVLCGYQGWFRCPDDGTSDGWMHWSHDPKKITPKTITFEMWPDLSEYTADEKYTAPGFSGPDNRPLSLFSSANRQSVERHFRWMAEYGIDGVLAQRFLVELNRQSFNTVLQHIRPAAANSGRVYAVCYDLTGTPQDRLYDLLVNDWKRLVDEMKITQDDRYLHHDGKPVLFVWGFFDDRFDASVAHRLIDFLKGNDRYGVTLIGGCQWQWRTVQKAEWARAFRRFDVISPWNVGNYALTNGNKTAATHFWNDDIGEAKRYGMQYLPVIYPGFGWTNLEMNRHGRDSAGHTIPRRGGKFFWEQFVAASQLGIEMAYVAMFDEVDEATAIFKVSNTPPNQARFQTYDGLPSDWYLRLTGEGTKVIRGEQKADLSLPIHNQ